MAKSTSTPKAGDQVSVRYLENPNAVETDALATVLSVNARGELDVEIPRHGRLPVRLERVALHEGPGRRPVPSWVAAPAPAPTKA